MSTGNLSKVSRSMGNLSKMSRSQVDLRGSQVDLNSVIISQTSLAELEAVEKKVSELTQKMDWFIKKKYGHKMEDAGDENEARGNWSGKFDFFLSCLGYAVGLGNVWRFPYLCYKNGGGAFFIPYVIMLLFVGMPIFFLELSLGQFTSCGPVTCWGFSPITSGLGVAMVTISFLVSIYYNMILAWGFYYFFVSFTSKLPWQECQPEWASKFCRTLLNDDLAANCTFDASLNASDNGVCYYLSNGSIVGLWNETLAKEHDIRKQFPASDYLYNFVLKQSEGFHDFGTPDWRLVLCLLLAWVVIYLCLIKGIKSSGRVVYFTATFPYLILVILFIRGLMLPGYKEGIKFYITPDYEILKNSAVWKDAAVQIFFSLSTSWGGLIALASYNRFNNNHLKDALIVSIGNCLTSVFAGFVIFSYLGFLAHELNQDVGDVAQGGVGLAFTVYPDAVTRLPPPSLWAIMFFVMIIILGLDSQFVLVETVLTSIMDVVPKLRPHKSSVLLALCAFSFVLGLSLTCPGGPHMLALLDTYAGGWNVLVVAIIELISICYFYGFRRFRDDIEVMLGPHPFCLPWKYCSWYWYATWGVIAPILLVFVLFYNWISWEPTKSGGIVFPVWADVLGMMTTVFLVLLIFIIAGITLYKANWDFKSVALVPHPTWGPALVKHRKLVKHVPNFIVNPWPDEQQDDEDEEVEEQETNLGGPLTIGDLYQQGKEQEIEELREEVYRLRRELEIRDEKAKTAEKQETKSEGDLQD